jgi:hypothetical protein
MKYGMRCEWIKLESAFLYNTRDKFKNIEFL